MQKLYWNTKPDIHDGCFLLNNRYKMLEQDMKKIQTIENSKFTWEIIQHLDILTLLIIICMLGKCMHAPAHAQK
jgi:hypothetical protein